MNSRNRSTVLLQLAQHLNHHLSTPTHAASSCGRRKKERGRAQEGGTEGTLEDGQPQVTCGTQFRGSTVREPRQIQTQYRSGQEGLTSSAFTHQMTSSKGEL